jgi:hypothetical protein
MVPNSTYCHNCGKSPFPGVEKTEGKGMRTLLLVISIYLVAEFFFWRLIQVIANAAGSKVYDYTRPVSYLASLFFAAIPLIFAAVLPKSGLKTTMLVIGIVFLFVRIVYLVWMEFFQVKEFVYFNF